MKESKTLNPESDIIDKVEVPSLDSNQTDSNNHDVMEHQKSRSESGSNRTRTDDKSMKYSDRLYCSTQSLFEHPISDLDQETKETEKEIQDSQTKVDYKPDGNGYEDNLKTETQLSICGPEIQSDSWSSLASQASSVTAPPVHLLLEFQDRIKELEASVQASQPSATPIDPKIDWYTKSVYPHSQNKETENLATPLEKDISTALAIANILETRLIDYENQTNVLSEKAEQSQTETDNGLALTQTENTENIHGEKRLAIFKEKKTRKKSRKSEPKDMTTITIPDIHDMKERIKRLSETLANANTKIAKDSKQDGRKYRYSDGLKAVDVAELPPSITKFMRT